jgi:hypothetical protein
MSGSMKIVPANGGSPGVGTTDVVGAADCGSDVGEVDASGVGGAEVVGAADGWSDVGAADGWSDVDEVDDGDPTPLHAEPAKAATKTDATILFID